jgi:hypothetical protein
MPGVTTAARNCLFLGNGNGTFKPKLDFDTGGKRSNAISAADFNNDGNADVVVSNSESANLSVFMGNGDGTFHSPLLIKTRTWPTGSAVRDFNRDGFTDIAVAFPYANNYGGVMVFLNNQNGGFRSNAIYASPLTFSLISGDLNGDGFD